MSVVRSGAMELMLALFNIVQGDNGFGGFLNTTANIIAV